MLLYGKPVIEKLFAETCVWVENTAPKNAYVAIFLLSDDFASSVYVKKKQNYAKRCGLGCEVFHHPDANIDDVLKKIHAYNNDATCLGIVVQLPLAKHLKPFQSHILHAVSLEKDIDGLNGIGFGLNLTEVVNFLPATPKATLELLDFYGLGDVKGKVVMMIGQSNLMGKPFVVEMMHRGATVISCNSYTPYDVLKMSCQGSDYIVSATGVVELITPELFDGNDLTGKIFIDVGYGIKDGKACGDMDWSGLAALGATITPVPGGVGPVTVACLFHNVTVLEGFLK